MPRRSVIIPEVALIDEILHRQLMASPASDTVSMQAKHYFQIAAAALEVVRERIQADCAADGHPNAPFSEASAVSHELLTGGRAHFVCARCLKEWTEDV